MMVIQLCGSEKRRDYNVYIMFAALIIEMRLNIYY